MTDQTVSAEDAGSIEDTVAIQPEPTQSQGLGGDADADEGSGPKYGENDYRSNLPSEIAAHPALKDADSVEKLAQHYVNAQKLIGRKGIIPPGEDASPEEMEAFYDALGRPSSPDEYDLSSVEVPEGMDIDETVQAEFLKSLHAKGASQEVVQETFNTYWKMVEQAEVQSAEKTAEAWSQTRETLRAEMGAKEYAEAETLANRMVSRIFGEKASEVLSARLPDGTKLSANEGFVRTMIALAKSGKEADLIGGKDAALSTSPEAARAELDKFNSDNRDALLDREHPDHAALVKRRSQLSAMAYPETNSNSVTWP